ncbi:MAG: hypothetical protein ACK4RV_06855 [Caulobacter sp.]
MARRWPSLGIAAALLAGLAVTAGAVLWLTRAEPSASQLAVALAAKDGSAVPRSHKATYAPPLGPQPLLEHGNAEVLAEGAFHSVMDWDHPVRTYRIGAATITVRRPRSDSDDRPGLLISVPGQPDYRLETDKARFLEVGVGQIDPGAPGPQILYSDYTGGAHCCADYRLITPRTDGRPGWRVVVVAEQLDGGIVDWPRDRDGDGVPDLMVIDDAFLHFGPYQDRSRPLRFFQVEGGQVRDVSRNPGFRAEYLADMRRKEPSCREGLPSACAGFVAAAEMAGDGPRAWAILEASYDRKAWAGWMPSEDFPKLLRGVLTDLGYAPAKPGGTRTQK